MFRKVLLTLLLLTLLVPVLVVGQTHVTRLIQQGTYVYVDSLTSPGNFTSLIIYAYDTELHPIEEIAFQFIVTSTTNVSSVNVRVEASTDNINWDNVNSTGSSTSINVDDSATIIYTRVRAGRYYRAVFVDETGGTDGKVVVKALGG